MKILLSLFILMPTILIGQTKIDSSQMGLRDSVAILMKRIEKLEAIVYKSELSPPDNLKNKNFGVEINPGFLMFGTISGGIQIFSLDRKAEISIPFFYFNKNNFERQPDYIFSNNNINSVFDIDIQYRKFSGKIQNGLWFGLGLKYTHVEFEGYNNPNYDSNKYDYFGAIFGVGYRTVSSSGFYYGVSCMIGRYFNGKDSHELTDRIILNIEMMKLGYAF